ncbi:MAG TPA: (deoxy)nucleoside triphosphate pyrophosphohydrolase [Planctomycetaceae bacterium]|nr:(deoxy)nucleoside triphosphate pyrophosphohydrolase [Planctomycetaceae bacterium]
MSERITRVGIAIVEHAGRFLVGVRPEGTPLAGAAEFPGGKCDPDETPSACAERECLEETGVTVTAVTSLETRTHAYAHGTVEIHFWRCRPVAMPESLLGAFRWVETNKLASLPFPEANASVIQKLLADR